MNLFCRHCQLKLTSTERGPVRYWTCGSCGGHAFTEGALRRTLAPELWRRVWPALRNAVERSGTGCPLCERSLDETVALPEPIGIRLDFCDRCRLVWLDPHELDKLPKAPVEEEEPPLSPEAARAMVEMYNYQYDETASRLWGPTEEQSDEMILVDLADQMYSWLGIRPPR